MPDFEKKTKKNYFIGANTCNGFINCTKKHLYDLNKLYIIKGGPGTGKSTFLKIVASRAEALGYNVERYFCSSDPSSLDAIVIVELSVGIADGTPPHTIESLCPGIKEELIDFGRFWNKNILNEHSKTITALNEKKSACYTSAYRYLKALSSLKSEEEALLYDCFDYKKAEKAIERIMKRIHFGDGFTQNEAQVTSFGMNGKTKLSTYEDLSDTVYSIEDKRGVDSFIFDIILKEAKKKNLTTHISFDPLTKTDAVFFPEAKLSFVIGGNGKPINTERFIIKEKYTNIRQKARFINYLKNELLLSAEEELRAVKKYHFSLEELYSEAMDYEGLNEMTEEFVCSLLKI